MLRPQESDRDTRVHRRRKKWSLMRTFTLSVLALVATSTTAWAQRGGEPQPPPALVVTGSSEVLAVPDQAIVRLGIVRQANTAQAAQEQANAVGKDILNAISRTGVTAQQIQTSRLLLTPNYAHRSPESRDSPRIVASYASNYVYIR